jgi:CubicO group peptidase (beta-lactamase class C family)
VNQGDPRTDGGGARVPFPVQRPDTAWPTHGWPTSDPADDVDADTVHDVVAALMARPDELGVTRAVLVVHRGRIVAEAYGPDTDVDSTLISWSTAKSITHALVGIAVGDGLLDVEAPAAVPEWRGDERAAITLQHLLTMHDGLDFNEEYVDVGGSHVVDMLFVDGKDDVAGYAAARPLAHTPGTVWNYSSGTTNIVSRLVGEAFESAGTSTAAVLADRLFGPLGMSSAVATFDPAGTFIGSSFVYATARDFARFGLLYLRDGLWDGVRLLPEGWADHARTRSAVDEASGFAYGAHWWIWPDQRGSLAAHGYEGQYVVVVPERDLVVVRPGVTDASLRPNLVAQLRRMTSAFSAAAAP